MKKHVISVTVFALFFLFFIQMAGTLVQSIYILDLMNTSLDARAAGVLFFFTPALLLPFRKRLPAWLLWVLTGLLLLARGFTPWLPTSGRLLSSGVAVGASLLLMPFFLAASIKGEAKEKMEWILPAGLALGVALSVFLRGLDFGLDLSLTPPGAWTGWLLCLAFGLAVTGLDWNTASAEEPKSRPVTGALLGLFLVLVLVYFAFSAPAVIARWTEGNYPSIVVLISLLSLASVFVLIETPWLLRRLSHRGLVLWNGLFTLAITATLLAHRVTFPAGPASSAVIVGAPSWLQQVPLYLMLLLFPVIFLDVRLFLHQVRQAAPSPRQVAPGLLLGGLALVVLVFISIFTNVWGYIEPVSTPFRNMFWLPFFLITAGLTLLAWRVKDNATIPSRATGKISMSWLTELAVLFVITLLCVLVAPRIPAADLNKTSLKVMTYNIQAGCDAEAERSYDRQLALIRQVDPDILALQETDTTRISMNNDDLVRYFAGKLGYYSYYGPTTVTGTFGTAILSKYPLQDTRSVFTYSDTDEIGTAEATITVDGRTFHFHDVHPDGSDAAKLVFAQSLVQRTSGESNAIALGDYNAREDAQSYQVVAAALTDAWKSLHPNEVGQGKGWIDHIFLSRDLQAVDPTYILPPESASDHPAHWTVIRW